MMRDEMAFNNNFAYIEYRAGEPYDEKTSLVWIQVTCFRFSQTKSADRTYQRLASEGAASISVPPCRASLRKQGLKWILYND